MRACLYRQKRANNSRNRKENLNQSSQIYLPSRVKTERISSLWWFRFTGIFVFIRKLTQFNVQHNYVTHSTRNSTLLCSGLWEPRTGGLSRAMSSHKIYLTVVIKIHGLELAKYLKLTCCMIVSSIYRNIQRKQLGQVSLNSDWLWRVPPTRHITWYRYSLSMEVHFFTLGQISACTIVPNSRGPKAQNAQSYMTTDWSLVLLDLIGIHLLMLLC